MKRIAAVAMIAMGTVTAAPLHAADLMFAEPVEYVRICDAYGTGYLYIPGTETCLRIAGRIRADYNVFFDSDDENGIFDDYGFGDADDRGYRFRARGYIYLDSRTSTEFGLLRTYLELETTLDSLDRGDFGGGGGTPDFALSLERAYIEFGGFTFGRVQSFYDFQEIEFTETQTFDPGFSEEERTNAIAYNFDFGSGFNVLVAVEDTTARRLGIVEGRYGGAQVPDILWRLRWENDDVGVVQLMAAGHYVNAVTPDNPAGGPFRATDEAYGFAVGGGAVLNVPIGNDTKIGASSTYTSGALAYASTNISAPFGVFDGAFGARRNGRIGDGLELSEAISVTGGFSTKVTKMLTLNGQLGYIFVDMPDTGVDNDEDGNLDDLDVQNFDAQAYVAYKPLQDFELGLGVEYRFVDPEDFESASAVTTFLRAQRTF